MEKAASKLKNLRKLAVPKMTVRAMAEALEMPLGTYARYESAYDFKKQFLPLDLTRRIADVLSRHGVDPAEVMTLAGLTGEEAEPEARAIEASRPEFQVVYGLPTVLPSEAALKEMFRALLRLLPENATRDEVAEFLAQQLPAGFAGIGPFSLAPGTAISPAGSTGFLPAAKEHPASPQ